MHAEGISNVSAAEVGAAPELVTGLGVGTATGTKLGAGSLTAAGKGWLTSGVFPRTPPLNMWSLGLPVLGSPWVSVGSPHFREV